LSSPNLPNYPLATGRVRSIFAFGSNLQNGSVPLSSGVVGMFIGADNRAYESKEAATASGTSAKAWIFDSGKALALNDFKILDQHTWNSIGRVIIPIIVGYEAIRRTTPKKAHFDTLLPLLKELPKTNDIIEDGITLWSYESYDEDNAYYLYFSGADSHVGYKDKNDSDEHNHFRLIYTF
jgi:hypothetical protein